MGLVDRLVEHWMVQNSVHPVNTIVREQQEAIVGFVSVFMRQPSNVNLQWY